MTSQEYFEKYGENPFSAQSVEADATRAISTGMTAGIMGFGKGVAKSGVSAISGMSRLGDKILGGIYGDFHATAPMTQRGIDTRAKMDEWATPQSRSESVGKFAGDVAQFVGASALTKGLGSKFMAGRLGQAATAGAVGTVQRGPGGGVTAAASSLVVPPVIKGASNIVGSVFKKIGAGLSGSPAKAIDAIIQNPAAATVASREIKQKGARKLLEKNTKKILDGVMSIRQEARRMYGQALDKIKPADINPAIIRTKLNQTMTNLGVRISNGKVSLTNSEVTDPVLQRKLARVIQNANKMKINSGKGLKRFIDTLEDSQFKVAPGTDSNRLAFNRILNQMKQSTMNALNETTDKLRGANRAFSSDMQLIESIQSIFGKIQFNNTKELLTASKRLENLFKQKGLTADTVERFLARLGEKPGKFLGQEGFRQVAEATTGGTPVGTTVSEFTRALSGSVINPQAVAELARLTGIAQHSLTPILERLSPVARAAMIRALLGED